METSIDPLTGEEFVPKRSNQKFASRQNQINYNNQRASKERRSVQFIQDKLKRNRDVILKLLGGQSEVVVNVETMQSLGFSFYVLTHLLNEEDRLMVCIYDVGYQKINEKEIYLYNYGGND